MKPIRMTALRVLAIAVASGRIGCVFLIDDQLMDWRMSRVAAKSPSNAVGVVQQWIIDLKPDVVVTEKLLASIKKGERTREIISAITGIASYNYVLDVSVPRAQDYANKYEEAAELVKRFPELAPWLPKKRRFYDNEPRETVLFEALALALVVLNDPATELAAGMG